jgi:hypothetical protein
MSSSELSDLGWDLASAGFAGREHAVRQIVRTARSQGVPAALTDVLGNTAEPEVARLRAFGRVAVLLATPQPSRSFTQAA